MKQKKVMDVMHRGQNLICIKTDDKLNPYRVYLRYYDLPELTLADFTLFLRVSISSSSLR